VNKKPQNQPALGAAGFVRYVRCNIWKNMIKYVKSERKE
jgi:hypothetical protein